MKRISAKQKSLALLALALFFGAGLIAWGENSPAESAQNEESKEVIVGVSPVYAEISNIIKEEFDKSGYVLTVKVFDDNILPNVAVDEGSVHINFFQHLIYLDRYNASNGTDIVAYDKAGLLKFFMGIFPRSIKSLSELPDGATVSIPNDNANRSRALKTLAYNELITLKDGVEFPTVLDVVDNPKKLKFIEMDVFKQASSVQDVDISVINSVTVKQSGQDPQAAIVREDPAESQRYSIIVGLKRDSGNEEYARIFTEAAHAGRLAEYLDKTYSGALYLSK